MPPVGRAGREQRVAVGRRAHDRFGADIAAGARPVFDDDRLPQPLLQLGADQPHQDVADAAPARTAPRS